MSSVIASRAFIVACVAWLIIFFVVSVKAAAHEVEPIASPSSIVFQSVPEPWPFWSPPPSPSATPVPTPKPTPRPAASHKPVAKPVPKPTVKPRPLSVIAGARLAKSYTRARLSATQFNCLNLLWTRESGWRYNALNRSSGAYGIPQSLPGTKMATAGSDWRTNPITQVRWGLRYIAGRYGTPCAAWAHSQRVGWY